MAHAPRRWSKPLDELTYDEVIDLSAAGVSASAPGRWHEETLQRRGVYSPREDGSGFSRDYERTLSRLAGDTFLATSAATVLAEWQRTGTRNADLLVGLPYPVCGAAASAFTQLPLPSANSAASRAVRRWRFEKSL